MQFWCVVPLERVDLWPTSEVTQVFEGTTLYLRPTTDEFLPDARCNYEHPGGETGAFERICRFLSLHSWWYRSPALIGFCQFGNAPIRVMPSVQFSGSNRNRQNDEMVQSPGDPRARLAIAIYREAKNMESIPFEFLGYFKILNILYGSSKAQQSWINTTIANLTDQRSIDRVKEIQLVEPDIGKYLYASGRCAVAHATSPPVINPDCRADLIRLAKDLPLIRALAEHLVEHELGLRHYMSR